MATCLSHGLSADDFWNLTPKALTALIRGFRKVEQERASYTAFFVWGGKVENLESKPQKVTQQAAFNSFFM
jgi:hypothetical protein